MLCKSDRPGRSLSRAIHERRWLGFLPPPLASRSCVLRLQTARRSRRRQQLWVVQRVVSVVVAVAVSCGMRTSTLLLAVQASDCQQFCCWLTTLSLALNIEPTRPLVSRSLVRSVARSFACLLARSLYPQVLLYLYGRKLPIGAAAAFALFSKAIFSIPSTPKRRFQL